MQNKDNELLIESLVKGDNTLYSFKTLDHIPTIRLEAYLARHHEFKELGMVKADLRAFCLTIEEFGKEGRFVEVMQLIGYFKTLLDRPVTLYPTIFLASPLVLVNNEPIDEILPEYEALKTELALKNSDVESFFLGLIIDLGSFTLDLLPHGKQQAYSTKRERIVEEIFHQAISGKRTSILK